MRLRYGRIALLCWRCCRRNPHLSLDSAWSQDSQAHGALEKLRGTQRRTWMWRMACDSIMAEYDCAHKNHTFSRGLHSNSVQLHFAQRVDDDSTGWKRHSGRRTRRAYWKIWGSRCTKAR